LFAFALVPLARMRYSHAHHNDASAELRAEASRPVLFAPF
jgi:hypothetical protein